MPEDTGVQRTRKCTSKSKQGCKTCKIRRVKCDEQRPNCLRCLRWGIGICGGYADVTSRRPVYQPLQPALLRECHTGPRFQNEEEHRYFQLFRHQVAPYLDGVFETSLWDHLLAQACVHEPFVLDSFMAIGALARSMSIHEGSPFYAPSLTHLEYTSSEIYTTTYEYSLKRYNKAIQAMKTAISDKNPDMRRVLIACLLIYCFETLIGNQGSAIRNAQSVIFLLHQWQSKNSLSCTVEDELIQAAGRLDLQILIILDLRPTNLHQAMKEYLSTVIGNMPAVLKTLKEAKMWCELIMRRNYHFRAEASSVGNAQKPELVDVPPQNEDSLNFPMNTNVLMVPQEVPESLLPQYQEYLAQWNRWSMACRLLFMSLRTAKDKDWIGATVLLIQSKMSCISLASAFTTSETVYDEFLSEFQEIVTLIFSVHENLMVKFGVHIPYHFDGGIIPSLFYVATKCRDRTLRRKVIQILSLSPWREGVFDSACVHNMATWIMGVEEEGLGQEDHIPDHRRLRIRWSNIDLPRRKAHLRATQFKTADDADPEWRETILTW